MPRRAPLAPKRPEWLRWTIIAAVVAFSMFALAAWWSPWRPGRFGGLLSGTMAALLFLNAAIYPARRRLRARPWRTAQQWLQFHIYGSVIATWLVLIHVGFRLPVGQLGWWLWSLSLWTAATGLAGVFIQKWVPSVMTRTLRVEAIYERIPDLVGKLVEKADRLVQGAPDMLAQVYGGQVRPLLATPALRWGYLFDIQGPQEKYVAPLKSLSQYLAGTDRERLDGLESIMREKLELDAHASLQRLLRTWLVVHVPPAIVLMALLTVHIVAVLVF